MIKTITYTTRSREVASELISPSNPQQSVDAVNKFFANVGKSLAEKHLPQASSSVSSLPPKPACPHSFVMLPTDENEINNLILNLKINCTAGRDNISANFLSRYRPILVYPLTFICNLAFISGSFPRAFKISQILPIFKSGDRDCVNNYRPISILPTLSKILEKLMNKRLTKYLEKFKLLSDCQYGFRCNKTTSDAVHEVTDYVVSTIDDKNKALAIFIDLAKAFDTVFCPQAAR